MDWTAHMKIDTCGLDMTWDTADHRRFEPCTSFFADVFISCKMLKKITLQDHRKSACVTGFKEILVISLRFICIFF